MNNEIKYNDIQKGDTIRRSMTIRDITETRAGVVADKDSEGNWMTDGGSLISYIDRANFYLIDRPAPPLPTKPGTVFRATEIRGVQCDVKVFVRESLNYFQDIPARIYNSATPIDGEASHFARHITAWEPIEVQA